MRVTRASMKKKNSCYLQMIGSLNNILNLIWKIRAIMLKEEWSTTLTRMRANLGLLKTLQHQVCDHMTLILKSFKVSVVIRKLKMLSVLMFQANWKAKVIKNPINFLQSNLQQRRKKTMSLHLFMTLRKVENLHLVLIFLHQCIARLFHHIWLVMKNKKNITLKMFILERRIMKKPNLKVLMWENMNLSERLSQNEAMNIVLKQAKNIDHNLKVAN